MVTIVTLGYGDIIPKSEIARSLVIIESIVGIGWITVIFAAVLAHLQPRFSVIAKIQREQAEEVKREEARKNSTG